MSIALFAFMALTKTKKDETNNVMYGHLDQMVVLEYKHFICYGNFPESETNIAEQIFDERKTVQA